MISRQIRVVIMIAFILFLAACGQEETERMLLPIDVKLQIESEQPMPQEQVLIQAVVTQGEEAVNDADEVKFEIWEKGQPVEEHLTVMGELEGEGVYSTNHSFEADGVYYVISHVTARDFHSMPKEEIVVGNPDLTKYEDTDENEEHMEMDMNE